MEAVLQLPWLRVSPAVREKAKSLFITFEGIEGSGKSTQSEYTAVWMRGSSWKTILTREPYSDEVCERFLREDLSSEDAIALAIKDRREHVAGLIRPALDNGIHVLCKSFMDATFAYQCYGREEEYLLPSVKELDEGARQGVLPDLTILLDIDPRLGLARKMSTRVETRFERENLKFHDRVRRGYLRLAHKEPKRFMVINAEEKEKMIFEKIRYAIQMRLRH